MSRSLSTKQDKNLQSHTRKMESTSLPPLIPRRLLSLSIIAVLLRLSAAASPFPKEALPTKSGYLTVNAATGSAIFYTFYEAQNSSNTTSTPLLIWLQGGPGCSSMLGNFYELGPWLVKQDLSLGPNPGSWNRIFGLLFLDNPIGSGFSYAASTQEIPRDQEGVAKHLFVAIKKFIGLDQTFKSRPVYITGESYAGKYVPAIGYYILRKNPTLKSEDRVNLAGVAIGNGFTDPELQVATHAENAYNVGVINEKQKILLEELQSVAVGLVRERRWREATEARSLVMNTLANMTGMATLYDFTRLVPYQDEVVAVFLNNVEAKRALRANESIVFELCSGVVSALFKEDMMKSTRSMVEFLVRSTRVLLYQGMYDLRIGVVANMAWMREMEWEDIDEFLEAERKVWRVEGKLAGYVQKWKNLSHVVVMNAGHLVPADQSINSQVMIENWVLEKEMFAAQESENKEVKSSRSFI